MPENLLRSYWTELDSYELRLLLSRRFGGLGQYRDRSDYPKELYLPQAGSSCRIVLTFSGSEISTVEPGPAFDVSEWERVAQEIEGSILSGPARVGRDYSFSSVRVSGCWRGERSGIQILPPSDDAPRAPVEMAEHPFILEFPIVASGLWPITNHRRMREHRNLTLLLNVLLSARISLQTARRESFWARLPRDKDEDEFKWVNQCFFAKLEKLVIDELSPRAGARLEEVEPEEYYTHLGHIGQGLCVPTTLDDSICHYFRLSRKDRASFNRATFWMDLASRQWTYSVSSSFASLVSAVESLTDRGTSHRAHCQVCDADISHEVPGATERFRIFFEKCAPGGGARNRRTMMYKLRSSILHGSELM